MDDHQLCLRFEAPSNIPLNGYFGVTAATGGLSDDHDVLSFLTYRLVPMEERAQEVCVCVCEGKQNRLVCHTEVAGDQPGRDGENGGQVFKPVKRV